MSKVPATIDKAPKATFQLKVSPKKRADNKTTKTKLVLSIAETTFALPFFRAKK
jgi:hypothetical protein